MLDYEDRRVNVLDLTGTIHNTEDSHIGINTRETYYHKIIDFMIFMLTISPEFIVFQLKNRSILPSRYPDSENNHYNKFKHPFRNYLDNIPMMNRVNHNIPS